MPEIKLTWLGHACFRIDSQESVLIDPYKDGKIPGLPPLSESVNYVFSSHDHDDHKSETIGIIPALQAHFSEKSLQTDHDEVGGALRGKSLIRVFDFEGISVAHMGDVGRALTDPEREFLKNIDCLLIPIGGVYTINAETAIETVREIKPRLVIPMHFRAETFGLGNIGTSSFFTQAFRKAQPDADQTIYLNNHSEVLCYEMRFGEIITLKK